MIFNPLSLPFFNQDIFNDVILKNVLNPVSILFGCVGLINLLIDNLHKILFIEDYIDEMVNLYSPVCANNVNCSICLEEYCNIVTNNCKHYFHKECLQSWLKKQLSCPLCRFNFRYH